MFYEPFRGHTALRGERKKMEISLTPSNDSVRLTLKSRLFWKGVVLVVHFPSGRQKRKIMILSPEDIINVIKKDTISLYPSVVPLRYWLKNFLGSDVLRDLVNTGSRDENVQLFFSGSGRTHVSVRKGEFCKALTELLKS